MMIMIPQQNMMKVMMKKIMKEVTAGEADTIGTMKKMMEEEMYLQDMIMMKMKMTIMMIVMKMRKRMKMMTMTAHVIPAAGLVAEAPHADRVDGDLPPWTGMR